MQPNVRTSVLGFTDVGWVTDLAPQSREFNFLTRAENVIFQLSGSIRKVGGTTRINATALTGTPSVLGLYDFWLSDGVGSETQLLVAFTSDSKIYSLTSTGVATDRTGAAVITANSYPCFAQGTNLLTIWTSSADTPLKYNQTGNVASLGGTPPSARVAAFHAGRMWAANTNANPSRLFYSAYGNIEDWIGSDTGSFDIDPEDGDRIIGLVSHGQRLIIFKGPNLGSTHAITGTAPTGGDGFARKVIFRGLPLQSHNSIVKKGDDIWFMAHDGIYSLLATEKTGDFTQSSLTPLHRTYFRDDLNKLRFNQVWGANYTEKDCVLWAVPKLGSTSNNEIFGISYQSDKIRHFKWTRTAQALAIRINPTTKIRNLISSGASNGFIDLQDTTTRSLAGGTAYVFRVTTPQLILAAQDRVGVTRASFPFTLQTLYLRSRNVGNYNVTINLALENTNQSHTFNQSLSLAAGAGFLLGTDVLGTGILGSGSGVSGLQVKTSQSFGEGRWVEVDIQQGGLSEDAEIYEFGLDWIPAAQVTSDLL